MMVKKVVGKNLLANPEGNMRVAHSFIVDFRKSPADFNQLLLPTR
jgi:hypothetical protein